MIQFPKYDFDAQSLFHEWMLSKLKIVSQNSSTKYLLIFEMQYHGTICHHILYISDWYGTMLRKRSSFDDREKQTFPRVAVQYVESIMSLKHVAESMSLDVPYFQKPNWQWFVQPWYVWQTGSYIKTACPSQFPRYQNDTALQRAPGSAQGHSLAGIFPRCPVTQLLLGLVHKGLQLSHLPRTLIRWNLVMYVYYAYTYMMCDLPSTNPVLSVLQLAQESWFESNQIMIRWVDGNW